MAVLIGMSAHVKGRKFEIGADETFIGRNAQNHVSLDDEAISGRHCSVLRDGNKFFLVDLGSTNGTRLNGNAVIKSPLRPKDIIQIGSAELMFDGQDVEVPSTPSHDTMPIEVSSEPVAIPPTFHTASPFGSRRESRKPWVIATVILLIVVIAGAAYFISNLFGNN